MQSLQSGGTVDAPFCSWSLDYIQDRGKKATCQYNETAERVMDIKWYGKINNDEILSRAHLPWMAEIL